MENKNIQVFLRIRPNNTQVEEIKVTSTEIEIQKHKFTFTRVFHHATQQEIYIQIASKLIVECMQGYNCIIFAYGQTGSGKTHTIQGDSIDQGLIPKTLGYLLNNNENIKISFLEIYNEQLFDLFDIENKIILREDPFSGVYAENLKEVEPKNYEEGMKYFNEAIKNRRTSATEMNEMSSRSHSIFTIIIANKNIGKQSKILFVDLAGSEKLQNRDLIRKTETSNINKSLLCLGEVIKKLSKNEDHINYRDSKLTFLLRDSLAGRSKLAVIGTINSESHCVAETLSTLKFLGRVKQMKSDPVINCEVQGTLEELKSKIIKLDGENQSLKMQVHLKTVCKNENKLVDKEKIIYRMGFDRIKTELDEVIVKFNELKELVENYKGVNLNAKMEMLEKIFVQQEKVLRTEIKRLEILDFEEIENNTNFND